MSAKRPDGARSLRGGARTAVIGLLVLAGCIAAAWFATRGDGTATPHRADTPAPQPADGASRRDRVAPTTPTPEEPKPATPESEADNVHPAFRALRTALRGTDAEAQFAAAAALRGVLRGDAAAWRAAADAVASAATPADLRQALALVIGTIPDPDPDRILLETLAASDGDPAMARVLLIALGARREPADRDEAFDLGDRPWGEHGPGALGISVRRPIDDGGTRAAIAARLRHESAQVRRAAAVALRFSLGAPDARAAFETSLATESDDDVAQEVGEALVATAAKSGDPVERRRAVEVLLARAVEAPFDGLRFRTENDLHDLPLEPAAVRALIEMTDAAKPVGIRLFAWNVLAGSAKSSGNDALGVTRSGLVAALGADADAAVRDAAARLLGGLPADDAVVAALARALADDQEWNVRHAAARSLGAVGDRPGVRAALEAAARDADPRVVEQAAESLAGIDARRR